jgi:hypothetical protein
VTLGALSQVWISAEGAHPLGWAIISLVREPDALRWTATATGPSDTVTGHGDDPVQALHQLTTELRKRPGRPGDLRR